MAFELQLSYGSIKQTVARLIWIAKNIKTWLWDLLKISNKMHINRLMELHSLLAFASLIYYIPESRLQNQCLMTQITNYPIHYTLLTWNEHKHDLQKEIKAQYFSPDYKVLDEAHERCKQICAECAKSFYLGHYFINDLFASTHW